MTLGSIRMILEHVTLRDFCLFRGEQTFDLTPLPGRERGLASDRALWRRQRGRQDNARSTPSSSHFTGRVRVARSGPAWRMTIFSANRFTTVCARRRSRGSLAFRYASGGEEHIYDVVDRGVSETARSVKICACSSTERRPLALRALESARRGFLPAGGLALFFFDAEKIRSLAEDETSSQVLGSAVKSLLGLDIAERLIGDAACRRNESEK